jgi:CRP-like cAMP-binding protein
MDISRFCFINESIFSYLSDVETAFIKNVITQRTYAKGDDIFKERSYPKGIFILKKGKVKIYQKIISGPDQIMNIHVEGEIFGYRPVLSDERYPVNASAVEHCTVDFIPKKEFLQVLNGSAQLSNALLRFLSHEFTVWVNLISSLAHNTVRERLLLHLLILTQKYRSGKKWPVEIRLSKADLACLIGTSNETLARTLRLLKDERVVTGRSRALVVNADQYKKIEQSVSLLK